MLNEDLSTNMTSGYAVIIAANDVTIDCNRFKIDGLAAGTGTTTYGIYALSRANATARNCDIRGFYFGIYFGGYGGGHLIEGNGLDSNTHYGIFVNSYTSTIRNNLLTNTGGSTAAASRAAFGIFAVKDMEVINNTINGVAVGGANATAYGIYTGDGANVIGNRIRGLAPAGTGTVRGICKTNSGRGVSSDNIVQGPGPDLARAIGIYCTKDQATAHNNVILGFETSVQGCLSNSNSINPK